MRLDVIWGFNDNYDGLYHLYYEGISVCSLKLLLDESIHCEKVSGIGKCRGCCNVERKLNGTMVNKERDELYMKKVREQGA